MTGFDDVIALFLSKVTTFEEFSNLNEEEFNEEMAIYIKTAMAKFINKNDIEANYEARTFSRTSHSHHRPFYNSNVVPKILSNSFIRIKSLSSPLLTFSNITPDKVFLYS